ncbi:MAG TPA: type II secretion system protein GspK [Methylocella sp.]|nr:type II secretion system protein GspK [Methylocella sp.]
MMRFFRSPGTILTGGGKARPRGNSGFILVTVLWIFAALAALASLYAVYLGNTAAAARSYDARLQLRGLVTAGVELTAYQLIGYDDASRPTSGAFDFRLGRSQVHAEYRSEGARIDLNAAPKALLAGLFTVLGAKPDEANSFADRIVAWRSKAADGRQRPEAEAYRAAGLPYGPREAPFLNTAELRLVLGLPPALVNAALPFLTIYNGRAEIDPNEAPPQVVAAVPKMNPGLMSDILRLRDPRKPQAVMGLLGEARASFAVGARKATRVLLHIILDTGRPVDADVVFVIADNSPDPYRIAAWHDTLDGTF